MQNASGVKEWRARIDAGELATARGVALVPEDRLRAEVIERLMCDLRADVASIVRHSGFPAAALDREMAALAPLVGDGLAVVERGVVTVPEAARSLVRRVACVFDVSWARTDRPQAAAV